MHSNGALTSHRKKGPGPGPVPGPGSGEGKEKREKGNEKRRGLKRERRTEEVKEKTPEKAACGGR